MKISPEESAVAEGQIQAYVRRAKVLRRIHSAKGHRTSRLNVLFTAITLILATLVAIVGFFGTDRFVAFLDGLHLSAESDLVDSLYSVLVLALLLATLLTLVYRFSDRAVVHHRSLEVLTEYVRDYADLLELSRKGVRLLGAHDLDVARERYKGIITSLPANSDKEHAKAKGEDGENRAGRPIWRRIGRGMSISEDRGAEFASLFLAGPRREYLRAVMSVLGADYWITGGAIRDAVWDTRHGYITPSDIGDVDVVYFDRTDLSHESEERLRQRLLASHPNVRWSVKNEARFVGWAGTKNNPSLGAALRTFPETASAVAVRLGNDGAIEVLAPYGLDDLFELNLAPSTLAARQRMRERSEEKAWLGKWPKLKLQVEGGGRAKKIRRALVNAVPRWFVDL